MMNGYPSTPPLIPLLLPAYPRLPQTSLFQMHLVLYFSGCRVRRGCFQLALLSTLFNMSKLAAEILLRSLLR